MSEQGNLNLLDFPTRGDVIVGSWWRWVVPEPNPGLITAEPFEIAWDAGVVCGIRYRGTDSSIRFEKAQILAEALPLQAERGGP
jgi:hypothetical protein